ncbi:hypothetical protein [Glaciimonas immobilis]|uniref:Uncharacterized protein n=1 Tax=Glaciimonas immobilis TaxID=728004 RepID=A0A840RQ36_9BURK|nr:hypothetical protein [Glaciimonas immobilis]KAF3999265.1 hypothetical protein HAV38_04835 [Glaciimonas immobilis]MBB5198731.1 hypothetical protein [Glaciimonas immobilis]
MVIRHITDTSARILCAGRRVALIATLLLAAGAADATCHVVVSMQSVQLGHLSVASLRPASVAGYRSMGTKNQVINGSCDATQATFRLQFGNLTAIIGKPLVRWGEVGAMQLRIQGASVGGTPVQMKVEGVAASAYAEGVDITQNGVIALDLSRVPEKSRKSFSLQLQLTGLLPDNYSLRSKVLFESSISVQLVGEQ